MPNYNITVSEEVDKALKKKAVKDGVTPTELLQNQIDYYVGCALYNDFDPNHPINTPGLSIKQRLEVLAVGTNQGVEKARERVTTILKG